MMCGCDETVGNGGELQRWNVDPFSTTASRGRIEVSYTQTRNSSNESLMSGTAADAADA
jgi:hypothetical protein